ncbi:phosphate acetyltransferase [Candidatus Woesearchaeota archaeon]|nr:phosphate acetyltransferase [Candidatus Woesearchaeota archaeon]
MVDIKKFLLETARQKKARVIIPEADDERVVKAADIILKEKIAVPILIGENIKKIEASIKKLNLDLGNTEIITPSTSKEKDRLAGLLYELRKNKGLTLEEAKKLLNDQFYFGIMLLYGGKADAMTGTCVYPTASLIRPALQVIRTKEGVSTVAGVSIMLDKKFNKVFLCADADINIEPTSEQLADIAVNTAMAAEALGMKPKVAMLSYSTKGSGEHPSLKRIRDAVKIAKEKKPDLIIDGELQLDAAILKEGFMRKCPESPVKGDANCLVFPDLTSANIGLKLWMEFGDVQYIGPLNMGFRKPVNDLGRTFKPEDIANTVMLCAFMANKNL